MASRTGKHATMSKRKSTDSANTEIFEYVDKHTDYWTKKLKEMVEIDGVSGEPDRRPQVIKTGQWLKGEIEALGGKVRMADLGEQKPGLPLPPVVLGEFHVSDAKKTVCVYGHYDVQPASKSDGWHTEPFEFTEVDGKFYGRGTTDDKGPLLCWLWVVKIHHDLGREMPVNLKVMFEGMEESGSIGLDELIKNEAKKNGFLDGVDYICISDNYWLGKNKPCVTYGLRGNVYFFAEIEGTDKDLHSGCHGGAVREPMIDLMHLLSTLHTPDHKIAVPGLMEMVEPVTEAEEKTYEVMDFSVEEYKKDVGCGSRPLLHSTKDAVLKSRWRYPSLSIHGVEGAFWGVGAKTVIPGKVTGKFSIRTVPDMDAKKVNDLVCEYVTEQFALLGSGNTLKVWSEKSGSWWKSDPFHPNHVAAQKAQEEVWGVAPDLTREGGSIPITIIFEQSTGKNVVLLPIGACDDGAHSQNEKLDKDKYFNGIKVMAAYLQNLADIS